VTVSGDTLIASMRAPEPADGDRERVLDGALAAFLDFGIRRTSMGEIARRSGVSPATLYRRFAGKDEVVWAVGRREARRLIAEVDAGVDAGSGVEEQIAAMFAACLQGIGRNQLLQRLLATEPEVVLPLLTVHGGPVLDLGRAYLSQFIRRLQADHGLPAFDPAPVAELLARVALSMALLPRTCIPLADGQAVHDFIGRHLAPLLGVAAPAGA
jgi:AcrR family transcriptional regulator